MQRTLVVYFSRTGFTRAIAGAIAERRGADLDEIEDVRPRAGILGYLRSAREALSKRLIEIRPAHKRPAEYETVILGTPVWAGHMSSPMRAYLAEHKGELGRIAVFCTQGGSGAEAVFREIAELAGRRPVASLAVTDREIEAAAHADKLAAFLDAIALPKAA